MNFKKYADLIEDTKRFAHTLPNIYTGIISIPRSGNIPANIVALHFNIPVYTVNEFVARISVNGFTKRFENISNIDSNRYLVIDDSVNSGSRIAQTKEKLSIFRDYTFDYMCVYITPSSIHMVDKYIKEVPLPRIFEWNIFNHSILRNSYLDIDGVICPDPPSDIDEVVNEQSYIQHISQSLPMNYINTPVLGFITSRMEKYRYITEVWLNKHGFKYNELHMCNYKNASERRLKHRHGADKADVYSKSSAVLMIESSDIQAREIYNITKKPVYCTDTNLMYRKIT